MYESLSLLRLVIPLATVSGLLAAQAPQPGSLQQLNNEIAEQARQIADQQREIEALQAALEAQKHLIRQAMSGTPPSAAVQASPPKPSAAEPPPQKPVVVS